MEFNDPVLMSRIRQQLKTNEMQFGFVEENGSTDAIVVVRQMHEKFRAKGNTFYTEFVDLAPREVIR